MKQRDDAVRPVGLARSQTVQTGAVWRFNRFLTAALAIGAVVMSGCGGDEAPVQTPARPVTYVVLKETNPARMNRLTGSVDSWKKEMLSCRVAGRVVEVIEPGLNIEGTEFDAEGGVKSSGTRLAVLERDRYRIARDEAAARVDLTKANIQQARTELEQSIPEKIKEAQAESDRRKSQFDRQKKLLDENATSVSDYEESENWMKQADAQLAQAQISKATKAAELAALQAQAQEAEQALRRAEIDLQDCELRSPFSGQVSKVHAIAGSYLSEGMPIVTVQMMDPVKVELAVSAATDRRLRYDDVLDVYINDQAEPINGFVYLKDTVADAATRTFNITLLIRNRQVEVGVPDGVDAESIPRTRELFGLEARNADGKPPFFTDESTIHEDDDGRTFVWKAEGLTVSELHGDFDPVFTVKKVYVELGEGTLPILQLYRGRELTDIGELNPQTDLITGKLPDDTKEGDQVMLSRSEWLLRPGQLVHVDLRGETLDPGFYVPRPAILQEDGKHYVFVAETGDGQSEAARRVEVSVGPLVLDYRRIEAVQEGQLGPGDRLILDGAHYLRDGDPVNAFDEIEVSL